MSADIITDPRFQVGANGGPPMEDEAERLEKRHKAIAQRSMKVICDATGFDILDAKKQHGEAFFVRNLWLWAMQNGRHLPNNVLARIANLNRKTVTGYVQQLERYAERNGLLRSYFDQIADLVETLPGLVDDSEEAFADMALEAAIDRVKKSVDVLDIARPADRVARRA